MTDLDYEKHKKRCKEHHYKSGYVNMMARKEAIKLLIKKHRKDFDRFVINLKKEYAYDMTGEQDE